MKHVIAAKLMVIALLLVPVELLAEPTPLQVTPRHDLNRAYRGFVGSLSLAVSLDGKLLAYPDGGVRLWDLQTGKSGGEISMPKGERVISKLAFRADGNIVTDGPPEVLRVWSPETGKLIEEWKDLTSGAEQFAMNPAGDLLAIACSDPMGAGLPGSVRLIDVKTGQVRRELSGHRAMVTSVAFSANGRYVVSGSQDMSAAVWDVRSGRTRAVFRGHTNAVNTVAFSPDNKTVATGGFDRTVKLWDVARRKDRATLAGHVGPVTAMAFSPDGKFLVSGCTGGFPAIPANVIFWDTATGQKRAEVNLGGRRVTAIVFSKDGVLVTATGLATGGAVRSWDVKPD